MEYASDIAFTPAVKALQTRRGSRRAYARMEEGGSWQTVITPELKEFIEAQQSVFLATANTGGQPYIQHRGGPPGFLRVIDEHTIGFADFAGNRQYITSGNLAGNAKAHLFLMDYANKQRVKIWCTARVIEGDAASVAQLAPSGYAARIEQIILLTVVAWDANCSKHIPQRFEAADVEAALAARDRRIAALEAAIKQLRTKSNRTDAG